MLRGGYAGDEAAILRARLLRCSVASLCTHAWKRGIPGQWRPGYRCVWPARGATMSASKARSRMMSRIRGPIPLIPGRPRHRPTALAWSVGLLLAGCASAAWATASPSLSPDCQAGPQQGWMLKPAQAVPASATPCAQPVRQWAVHRSSLRRLVRWPACRADADPGTCGQPRCIQASGATTRACAKRLPAPALVEDRPFAGVDADAKPGAKPSAQPRGPSS